MGDFSRIQPDLFGVAPPMASVADGPTLRDRGISRTKGAAPDLTVALLELTRTLLAGRETVTSDDLHLAIDRLAPLDQRRLVVSQRPNLVGAVFRTLALEGKLRDSGQTVKTQRPSGQSRRLVVWEVV